MMYRSGPVSNSHFTRHSSASESLQGRRNQQGSLYSSRSSSGRRLPPSSIAAGLATTVPTKLGVIAQPVGTVPPSALLHQRKHSSVDLLAHSHHSFNWKTPGDKEEIIPRLMDIHLAEIVQRAFIHRTQPPPRPLSSILGSSSNEPRRLLLAVFQCLKGQVLTYFIYPTGELTELTERRRRLLRRYYDRGRQLVVLYLDEDNAEHYTAFPLDLSQFASPSDPCTTKKLTKSTETNSNSRKPLSSKSFSNSSTTSSSTGGIGPLANDVNSPPNSSPSAANNNHSSTRAPPSREARKRTPRMYKSPPFSRRSRSNDDVFLEPPNVDKPHNSAHVQDTKPDMRKKSHANESTQETLSACSSSKNFAQSKKRSH